MQILLLLLLILPFSSLGEVPDCPADKQLHQLLVFDDLFIGGIHGTREIPLLVQCLVDKALKESNENLIVSLELDESASDLHSPLWQDDTALMTEDGRSSRAMYALMQYLITREATGQLGLHFQYGRKGSSRPNSARATGRELETLSGNARVIVLAGNYQSMKTTPPGYFDYLETEGMYAGNRFTHINIRSLNPGTFWSCTGNCGISTYNPPGHSAPVGQLADGADIGHDYVFYLESFTASEPMSLHDTPR